MGNNPELRSKAAELAAELGSDIDAVAEFLATLSPNAYIYAVEQAGKIRYRADGSHIVFDIR